MNLKEKIDCLDLLSAKLLELNNPIWQKACIKAENNNPWFIQGNIRKAVEGICHHYLSKEKLTAWIDKYDLEGLHAQKTIALVLAGNIPLVGFHDILCTFLCDNVSQIKLSSKDKDLLPAIFTLLEEIDPRTKDYFSVVERLENFDAVIATGSNNSARYFNHYFGKFPNLIRKNRHGIAVISAQSTMEEILSLANDVFDYFGLGCRNVSKFYVEEGFEITKVFDIWGDRFGELVNHNKYKNNFDYNYAIYLLNKDEFLTNNIIVFKPDTTIGSRIACVNFEYYSDRKALISKLESEREQIQCIVSKEQIPSFKHYVFGEAQAPNLEDFADGKDTIQFLLSL